MRKKSDNEHESKFSGQKFKVGRKLLVLSFTAVLCLLTTVISAQDDPVKALEAKRTELKEKEEALKRDEVRLNALKKEVEARIETYSRLVAQMETVLKRVEQVKGDAIENVVKAYETMTPEEAAVRISALDNDTALRIMTRMKSKKAGAIIAVMEPRKAATLTQRLASITSTKRQQ
jgi:flagellar motility protein MotE (MotC chaperone)